ncbi:hypothetical protein [Saccharothrix sp. HUAS TT1]|uniref:hypothetical protein n=1 Tax=unclassified Saccharothrix TaxID=2593673 RepID=UPI00345C5437
MRYRPREPVLAVHYPVEPDPAREVEIRGLGRTLDLEPRVPFEYSRYSDRGRTLPNSAILLGDGDDTVRVPRGHWLVVHPRPGRPLLEVLPDDDFRAVFGEPDRSAATRRALFDAVAAEARFHLGHYVELRYLDANDHTTGMWAHPGMRAVVDGIRTQLREHDAELWEPVDPDKLDRWRRDRALLPVPVRVRPHFTRPGGHYGTARHVVPDADVRSGARNRLHPAGRTLCESTTRPAPLLLGPVTLAPPDCTRCLTHLARIAERRGHRLADPPRRRRPPTK